MTIIESDDLLEILQYKLQTKEPLSLIRYGDGEAIILTGFKDMKALNFVYRRQFGYLPAIDHAEEIRENLIQAYSECDIIGIPTRDSFTSPDSYWVKAKNILLHNVSPDILETKRLCSIDVHSHFLDKGHYKTLMQGQDTICYISCRNIDKEIKEAFDIKNVYSYQIAPEAKFTSGYKGEKHYPDQFNEIKKWMTRVPVEGNLCLVGAGVVGKVYCNWFRNMGGIGFDIGSIFDSWAGYATRGTGRGLNAVDNTFKL